MARERQLITDCCADPDRFAVFKDCIETYGMDYKAPDSEWPWNVLAKSTIAYDCGLLSWWCDVTKRRQPSKVGQRKQ